MLPFVKCSKPIAALKSCGVHPLMLTGNNEKMAHWVAAK
jgi:cation transport ATPase